MQINFTHVISLLMKNYFSYSELTSTNTMMFNDPTDYTQLRNLSDLWFRLNCVREDLGMPIYVNSAFRTKEVNKAVGGVYNSLHLQGRAADIRCDDNDKLKLILQRYKWKEFRMYNTFFHVAI